MKKTTLLAFAALSAAMLAMPAFASATPAHMSVNPGSFTVHGGASTLSRVAGGSTHGTTVTGSGSFENTTTGSVELTFHGVTNSLGQTCTTPGQPSGTVKTTKLPFHLVMLGANQPGILITPAAGGNHFASFVCGGFVSIVVRGDGILGTITSPGCGGTSNQATTSFESSSPGNQKHLTYTGENYDLESSLFGSFSTSAMDAHATITFEKSAQLICT